MDRNSQNDRIAIHLFYISRENSIGHVLDTQVIQNGSVLRTAVIFFYLSNEGISIIENVALIGLPVPKKLKEVLEQLHEEADEKKEDE